MDLRGQLGERGYAMAALLVALAVMSILMSAALPAWRHQAKREKEAELAFRGEQYIRAIQLYQAKMGPGMFPPSFDVLVQQKFLRKKYKDPMSPDGEFMPRFAGVNPTPGQTGPAGSTQGRGGLQQPPTSIGSRIGGSGRGNQPGGIIGVYSKSKEASIRVYRGATHYNEWQFVFAGVRNAPGGGVDPRGRGRGVQPVPGFPGIGGPGGGRRGGPFNPGGQGGPGGRGFGPGRGRGQ